MSNKFFCTLLLSTTFYAGLHAQDKKIHTTLKADMLSFRNQAVKLKEYKEEHKKIAALTKAYGGPVSITISIDADTTTEDDEVPDPADNIITGYIIEQTPAESITAYELHFDRSTKKIVDIRSQLEGTEPRTNKNEDEK